MPETVRRKMAHTSTGSVFCSWIELLGDKACRGEARGGRPSGCRMTCKTKRLALPGGRCAGHGRTAGGAVPRRRGAAACPRWSDRAQACGGAAPSASGGSAGAGLRPAGAGAHRCWAGPSGCGCGCQAASCGSFFLSQISRWLRFDF